jgi:hypothetical protein
LHNASRVPITRAGDAGPREVLSLELRLWRSHGGIKARETYTAGSFGSRTEGLLVHFLRRPFVPEPLRKTVVVVSTGVF